MDESTMLARQLGKCPNRFWYQINGKKAQENFNEYLNERQVQFEKEDEEEYTLTVESKVNTK